MELRVFIPDSPRRAVQAVLYFLRARKSPVRIYGIDDMRREHRKHISLLSRHERLRHRYERQRDDLIDVRKELTRLKRGSGSGWVQGGIANPVSSGSIPAAASID